MTAPFAARLKTLRLSRGLTAKALANAIGVTQRAVHQWEAGCREPRFRLGVVLAKALGVSAEELAEEKVEQSQRVGGNDE